MQYFILKGKGNESGIMDYSTLLRKSLDAKNIDLGKIGWTESQPDKKIFSYIRGYIWRNFGIRIKEPMDWIIYFMITESLSQQMDNNKG